MYNEAMDAFDESHEEGEEPGVNDYQYRDDDAVLFAAEAAAFVTAILPWLDGVRESLATDKSNDWSEELAVLDRIITPSQVGTVA
jgi:hypothetical protein